MGRVLRLPFGKAVTVVRDGGQALWHPGGLGFKTNLSVVHLDCDGAVIASRNLGSGVITNFAIGPTTGTNTESLFSSTATSAGAAHMMSGTVTTTASVTDVNVSSPIGTLTTIAGRTVSASTVTATGTISYSGTFAVSEWALFLSTTTSQLTWSTSLRCLDRRTFTPINVISGQSLTFTYSLTFVAGG